MTARGTHERWQIRHVEVIKIMMEVITGRRGVGVGARVGKTCAGSEGKCISHRLPYVNSVSLRQMDGPNLPTYIAVFGFFHG